MHGAYGRLDYMTRHKVWRVIAYIKPSISKGEGTVVAGIREVEVGRATTRETASDILHDWYTANKWCVKYA